MAVVAGERGLKETPCIYTRVVVQAAGFDRNHLQRP